MSRHSRHPIVVAVVGRRRVHCVPPLEVRATRTEYRIARVADVWHVDSPRRLQESSLAEADVFPKRRSRQSVAAAAVFGEHGRRCTTPAAIRAVRTVCRREQDPQDNIAGNRCEIHAAEAPIPYEVAAKRKTWMARGAPGQRVGLQPYGYSRVRCRL